MADFTVIAKLAADVSGFTSGISEASSSFDSLIKSTSNIGKGMVDLGSSMTKAFTMPMVGAVGTVVKSYADLEQAIGGVETLFKGSAKQVIANSESAYKRAGVSGVKYMEQVTSFSASLLQGLGGDTEAAAKYADKAVVDMSDKQNIVRLKRIEPYQGCECLSALANGENLRAVA